jgi:hypothetical protein
MDELTSITLVELEREARTASALARGIAFALHLAECQAKHEVGGLIRTARELAAECTAASQNPDELRPHLKRARLLVYRMLKLIDIIRPAAPSCFGLGDVERHLAEVHNLLEWLS